MGNPELKQFLGQWVQELSGQDVPSLTLEIEEGNNGHLNIFEVDENQKKRPAISTVAGTHDVYSPNYQQNLKQSSQAKFLNGKLIVANIWQRTSNEVPDNFLGVGLSEWSIDDEEGKLTEKKFGYTYTLAPEAKLENAFELLPWSIQKTFLKKNSPRYRGPPILVPMTLFVAQRIGREIAPALGVQKPGGFEL